MSKKQYHIHYIQNVDFEDLGYIDQWVKGKNIKLSSTKTFLNEDCPKKTDFDFLIILGGPEDLVNKKRARWVEDIKTLIQVSIKNDKNILAICLGAQILAECLGSNIIKNPQKEIGWFPISFCDTTKNHPILSELTKHNNYIQWHENTFQLPNGSIPLGSTELCKNQGFTYGEKIIGLQFHPEWTPEILRKIKACESHELFFCSPHLYEPDLFTGPKSSLFNFLDKFIS